jgi:hypothetical protein
MTRLRLTGTAPKEVDIQSAIEDALLHLHHTRKVAWFARVNGGGSMVQGKGGRKRFLPFYRLYCFGAKPVSKGISDIIGQKWCGRFFVVEVKRSSTEKPTEEQQDFLDRVSAHGALAVVATSVDDVFRALQ